MPMSTPVITLMAAAMALLTTTAVAENTPQPLRGDISVRRIVSTDAPAGSVRIAKDPRNQTLYVMKRNGAVFRINIAAGSATRVYTTANHGAGNTQGMAIGADGTMYIVGNEDVGTAQNRARIVKGVPDAGGGRTWSTLAISDAYPKSNTAYDHNLNAVVVSTDGASIFVNSGSRTDHGEVQTAGGLYPELREAPLTAIILKLPTSGRDLVVPNDREALRSRGYLFAEGIRNTFDMAFAANGHLFGAENGPASDHSDELNWLREGRHYGFPWRLGGADNPQQFSNYDPSRDKLLNPLFGAVRNGYWRNDPSFPPRPSVSLIGSIPNLGPDADSFRDPVTGAIRDGSSLGRAVRSFSAHRSPLGLVFDRDQALAPPYQGTGFVLGWTTGDPAGDSLAGPFKDASQDLLHLVLTRATPTSAYQMTATRIVANFNNPIDTEIIGNKIYVIDFNGTQSVWEVTLPGA